MNEELVGCRRYYNFVKVEHEKKVSRRQEIIETGKARVLELGHRGKMACEETKVWGLVGLQRGDS